MCNSKLTETFNSDMCNDVTTLKCFPFKRTLKWSSYLLMDVSNINSLNDVYESTHKDKYFYIAHVKSLLHWGLCCHVLRLISVSNQFNNKYVVLT